MGIYRTALAVVVLAVGCKDQGHEDALAKAQAAAASASAALVQMQAAASASAAAQAAAALAAERIQTAQQQKKAAERSALVSTPEAFLEVSGVQNHDKGIINAYCQLVGVTILNKSHYAVRDLSGDVTWLDAQGTALGAIPFTLTGSIPAGGTQAFSSAGGTLSSGTLQGKGVSAVLKFKMTPASVLD